MIKKIISRLGIIILLSLNAYVEAIVSYRLIQGPNGKLILILGEVHQDNATIAVVTGELKKAHLKKPLPVIVELSEVLPKELLGIESASIKALYALEKTFKNDAPFTLSCCESRGDMSDILQFFRKAVLKFCKKVVTEEEILQHTLIFIRRKK